MPPPPNPQMVFLLGKMKQVFMELFWCNKGRKKERKTQTRDRRDFVSQAGGGSRSWHEALSAFLRLYFLHCRFDRKKQEACAETCSFLCAPHPCWKTAGIFCPSEGKDLESAFFCHCNQNDWKELEHVFFVFFQHLPGHIFRT